MMIKQTSQEENIQNAESFFFEKKSTFTLIQKCFVSEIEFCEAKAALETSETRAKKFEAESIKLQKENTELMLELENSRKPDETIQEGLENE